MPSLFRQVRVAAAVCAALSIVACSAAPDAGGAERGLTLVYLKTGARKDLGADESKQVFAGHFANMERLARAGDLLVAGPFGQKRTDAALRGLFVLDTADPERARALAETDPGFQAGVFALEYHALATAAPLREFLQHELAETDAAAAAGRKPEPGETIRGYVLLIAEDGAAARAAIAATPAVLLRARLDDGGLFAILECGDRAAAEAALAAVRERIGPHRLEEWYASRNLTMVRGPGPNGAVAADRAAH